jgi:parallel beta-helix repeat protein
MKVIVVAFVATTMAFIGVGPAVARASVVTSPGCASSTAVWVHPGSHVHRVINRAPVGATICFSPGTYRLRTPLKPREGQRLVGHDAVLSGARIVRGFVRSGSAWVATGQVVDGQHNGVCDPVGSVACTYPNDVLRDGTSLRRVMTRAALRPGAYYVNYKRNRIVVSDDPRGHLIEIEAAYAAIESRSAASGSHVTVRGFTVEHVASPAQHGAINTTAPGWVIEDNTVRANHGAGIVANGHVRILRNIVVRNGEEGIAGVGDSTVVAHNVISHNDVDHFDTEWEAGGAKWAVVDGLVVRDNVVRDNKGPGLWTDIDSQHTTYEGNVVTGNTLAGIFHEISGPAVIRDNTVTGNGHGDSAWLWGSGILIAASHNVRVEANTLAHNEQGIGLVQQDRGDSSIDGTPRVLHDIAISDNIVHLDGGDAGIVEDNGDEHVFTDDTITWSNDNWYDVGGTPFEWDDTEISAAAWRAAGHDVGGTFR